MSFNTPVPGQRWVNNLTKALVFVDEIVTDEDEGVRPQLVYSDFNNKAAMDLDQFIRDFSLDQFYVPGPDPSLNVQEAQLLTVLGRSKEFHDVDQFHEKFGLIRHDVPGHLSTDKLRERVEFLQEELNEFIRASGFAWHTDGVDYNAGDGQDLGQQADALVDLVYVALGTAVMLGLPWDPLWDDVQRANMAKVRGMTKRGHAVDVTKPEGWVGPQTDTILRGHGYNAREWFDSIEVKSGGAAASNLRSPRDDTQR